MVALEPRKLGQPGSEPHKNIAECYCSSPYCLFTEPVIWEYVPWLQIKKPLESTGI